jgi:hypothetical protein
LQCRSAHRQFPDGDLSGTRRLVERGVSGQR